MENIVLGLLSATIRQATPLIYVAMAALVANRAGVLDVALEGKLLSGAFVAAAVSALTGSPWLGVIAAVFVGGMFGEIMWTVHKRLQVDIIITGLAVNLLVGGATIMLMRIVFGVRGSLPADMITGLPVLVSKPLWLSYSMPVFFLIPLVVATYVLYRHTAMGLRLRAAGFGDGEIARTYGLDVDRLKRWSMIAGGSMAGMGGAYLSLGFLAVYVDDMSAGRGFMGLALALIGRSRPLPVTAWCLFFGFLLSLDGYVSISVLPSQFFLMLPYAASLIALAAWGIFTTNKGG